MWLKVAVLGVSLLNGVPSRVIDTDTLELQGERVRLWDIQAPERREYCIRKGAAAFRCDDVGKAFVEALVASGVTCTPQKRDKYGRVVAACVTAAGEDVSTRIVQAGYALAYRRFTKHQVSAEDSARAAGAGWWSCEVTAPERWESKKICAKGSTVLSH